MGMGASRGLGAPQLARNQYGGNGYKGYGGQPRGGESHVSQASSCTD